MRRLAAGVYDDGAGGMHLALDELLEANGFADTPENRTAVIDAARELFGDAIVVDDADDWTNPVTGHGGDCGCISCQMSQHR